jgi:hypothetical protein
MKQKYRTFEACHHHAAASVTTSTTSNTTTNITSTKTLPKLTQVILLHLVVK